MHTERAQDAAQRCAELAHSAFDFGSPLCVGAVHPSGSRLFGYTSRCRDVSDRSALMWVPLQHRNAGSLSLSALRGRSAASLAAPEGPPPKFLRRLKAPSKK